MQLFELISVLVLLCLVPVQGQTNVYTVVNIMPVTDTNVYLPDTNPPAKWPKEITIGYTRPAAVYFHSQDGGATWTQCTNTETVSIQVRAEQRSELFRTGAETMKGMWLLEN